MRVALWGLLAGSLLGACTHSLPATLTPLAQIARVEPTKWPKASAVILRDARTYAFSDTGNAESTDERRHRLVQILRPDGRRAGNAVISLYDSQRIHSFAARTITADGRVLPVPRAQTFIASGVDTDGDATRRSLRFAFPEADVGSVLEYSVVLRSDAIQMSIVHPLDDALPVEHAHLRFSGTNRVHPEVHAHNLNGYTRDPADPGEPTGGAADGRWWIETEAFNVPARSTEGLSAHWSWRVPYAIFRQTGRVRSWGLQAISSTWERAAWYLGNRFAVRWGALPDDTVEPGTCGPADVLCRVGVAWTAVQTRIRPHDGWYLTGDPLSTVIERGDGNHAERAVYLWRALEQLGLEARPAAIVRRHGFNLDWTRPNAQYLDHLLVYMPVQPGLEAPLWLDPACVWCQPGQLLHRSRGTQALILDFDTLANKLAVTRKTVGGAAGPMATWDARVEAALTATGDLSGVRRTTSKGSKVRRWLYADPTPDPRAVKADLEGLITALAGDRATAQTLTDGCDADWQACTHAFRFDAPGYATVQGDRLVIPLSVFAKHGWLSTFAKPSRSTPLRIRAPSRLHDELRITLPPGYRILSAPAPIAVQGSLGEMAFKAWQDGDTLIIERRLHIRDGLRPASDFDAVKAPFDFYRRLRDAVVLVGPDKAPSLRPAPGLLQR